LDGLSGCFLRDAPAAKCVLLLGLEETAARTPHLAIAL
jgi:hypothetical protein